MNKKLFFILAISIMFLPVIFAQNETKQVYFFYSKSCPHCYDEMSFLQEFEKQHPEITIIAVPIWTGNAENDNLFKQMSEQYGVTSSSVPRTFIEEKSIFGFNELEGELEYRE